MGKINMQEVQTKKRKEQVKEGMEINNEEIGAVVRRHAKDPGLHPDYPATCLGSFQGHQIFPEEIYQWLTPILQEVNQLQGELINSRFQCYFTKYNSFHDKINF